MKTQLVVALLFLSGCAPADPPEDASSDDLIGGVAASSPTLDAIGVLTGVKPDGTLANLCSGILVGPHTVLAAKHCVEPGGGANILTRAPFYFEVGFDSAHPKRSVRAIATAKAPLNTGGKFGIGSDVGIFQLADDITDVTPLPIATVPIPTSDIGTTYAAVGYGIQAEGQTAAQLLPRRAGVMTLQALSGHPLHALWPTVDDFIAYVESVEGHDFIVASGDVMRASYNDPAGALIDGYEAYLGMGPHDVQECINDSGSPILRKVAGKLEVFGVGSRTWAGSPVPCLGGAVYATVTQPDNQKLISDAIGDECRGVPTTGACLGTTVVRCTPPSEGPRHIVIVDCADLNSSCSVVGGEAGCQ